MFAYGIAKQVDDKTQLADFSLLQFELIFATIMLVLLAVRFLYMRKTHSSSLPDETHPMQKLAARLVHLGMYVSLATIAISGIFVGVIYWIDIKDGLLIEDIIVVHELAVTTSYWLIACHVAAALFYRFKRDGVWNSMVPVWREAGGAENW